MSTWTEVLAAFHIAGDAADPDMDHLLNSIMGHPFGHIQHASEELAEDGTSSIKLPCGSEGPLQWDINLSEHAGIYRGCVSVWGSLRDYQDMAAVHKWFATTVSDFRTHGILYNAVCTASCNGVRMNLTHEDIKKAGK